MDPSIYSNLILEENLNILIKRANYDFQILSKINK